MSDQYGFEMNFGLVQNEDKTYDMGIHITDTDGTDINSDISAAKNIDKGLAAILKDTSQKIIDQRKKVEAVATAAKDDESMSIEEYETMIDDLIAQNDALVDEIDKLTHNNEMLNKRIDNMTCEKATPPKDKTAKEQEPKKKNDDFSTEMMKSLFGLDEREIKMLDKLFSKYL